MMNITFDQHRSLLQMQNGQPEIPTHRPVEVPDQNVPPEIQPQQRPQEAPPSPETPQIQPSETPTEVPEPTEQPVRPGDV